jgi:hypothetical protein
LTRAGGGRAAPTQGSAARSSSTGDKSRCNGHLVLVGEPKLLEGEHVAGAGEVREDRGIGDVVGGVGEVRIDAAEEVEDKLGVWDAMADIAEGIGDGFHLLAIL